jgi:hypothetical protein
MYRNLNTVFICYTVAYAILVEMLTIYANKPFLFASPIKG